MENEVVAPAAAETEETGPVLYNPKALSLVSSLANVFSWVLLVAFLGHFVAQIINLQSMLGQQGMTFTNLLSDPAAIAYLLTNISNPIFIGIALFFTLQGVSIGLNVLMEIDLKTE